MKKKKNFLKIINNKKGMTLEQFKLKLKLYLLENMETEYDLTEITDEILLELVCDYLYDYDDIVDQIYVKLDVDTLSFYINPGEYDHDNGGSLLGFKRLNNMGFCGLLVGGDYEIPIFLILFFDEEGRLKVYIPEKGNLYNKFTMETYEIEDQLDSDMNFKWGEIQKDIEGKVIKIEEHHMIEVKKPNKKEQDISQMNLEDLKKRLQDAVDEEEFLKAAEIKKEIDKREI